MAHAYGYSPLADPKSGIRLLSITAVTNGNIYVSLKETPNLPSQEYHCLSYTWGPPDPQIEITCDGFTWSCRQNLYQALIHLHQVLPDKMTSIWIDAICIDQQNDTEKGFQIKRMHHIYAGARSVIVWLGPLPSIPNSSTLISRFEDVASRIEQTFPNMNGTTFNAKMLDLNDGYVADLKDYPYIKEISCDGWLAVREVAYNGYFRRSWIWQEVIASKADPIVVCGGHVLSSWEALRKASHALLIFGDTILIRDGVSESRPDYVKDGLPTANLPHQLANARDEYREHGQPYMRRRFAQLVLQQNRNSFMCWDERDRLFAFVGICGFEKLFDWDYEQPFEKLYTHFWSHVMRSTKNVNFLTYVEGAAARVTRPLMSKDSSSAKYDAKIPSWVPDLRVPLEPASMWAFYNTCESINISKILPKEDVLGINEPNHRIIVDQDQGTLTLHGYLLDTIQTSAQTPFQILQLIRDILKDPWTEDDSHEGALGCLLHSLACLSNVDIDVNHGITQEMVNRARSWLVHDRDFGLGRSMLEVLEEVESLKELGQLDTETEVLERRELVSEVRQLDTRNLIFHPIGQTCRRYGMHAIAAIDWAMKFQRIFRTKGHWIGKGPEHLQIGDGVWIFPGALVGFVLRPQQNPAGIGTHTLVGQAYVAGTLEDDISFDKVEQELANKGLTRVVLA